MTDTVTISPVSIVESYSKWSEWIVWENHEMVFISCDLRNALNLYPGANVVLRKLETIALLELRMT